MAASASSAANKCECEHGSDEDVPLASASAGQSYLRVATAKERFKDARSTDTDVESTAADEAPSYRHLGLEYRPAGAGALRLAKH